VHLLGIAGTAMTALAGLLQARGMRVTGSDEHVYPPMSDHLRALGIPVNDGYRPANIPADTELVIVGNVIRERNPEAQEMRRRGLAFLSMAEAVRRFAIESRHSIVIVGTHGKTTTTALAAHALTALGADPGFLIGGIAQNFDSNFHAGAGEQFVIEGDEYDTAYFDKTPKFFKYNPRTVLFTSLEFDHADIYPDLDAIRAQFRHLIASLPARGALIACGDDPNVRALLHEAQCPVIRYGLNNDNGVRVAGVQVGAEGTAFTTAHGGRVAAWTIPLAGAFNALNATAVIALLERLGYSPKSIQTALHSFKGVKRRQEVRGEAGGVTVLDDFAHHPTAVRLTIEAVRQRYPGRRLWAVFEPRSFTARTSRFQTEFAEAFRGADRVLLAAPFQSGYSAGQELLDTTAIAESLSALGVPAHACPDSQRVLDTLIGECRPADVVLIMSNGGFDNLHERLLTALAASEALTTAAHAMARA
jgi:UDP-N-acetylmuramate: L-alanyl-gamma-D-glutamyl-meso-diaminopimelate ligase